MVPPNSRTPDAPPDPTPPQATGGGTTPQPAPAPAPRPGVPIPRPNPGNTAKPAGGGASPGHGRKSDSGESRWEYWWANNGYQFYRFGAAVDEITSGSADFLLGKSNREHALTVERTSDRLRNQLIVPALREALGYMKDDHEIRAAAVKALGRVGGKAAIPDIEKLLRDEHIHVRFSAALALGFTRAPEAAPLLRRVVSDTAENLTTRAFAAAAIGLTGDSSSSAFLQETARNASTPYDVRAAAMVGLGLLGDSSSVSFLVSIVQATDGDAAALRALAAISLGKLGGKDAIAALEKAARDDNADVRRSAVIGLGRSAPHLADADAATKERIVTVIDNVARKDQDVQARCFATIALGQIGGNVARRSLVDAFNDGTHVIRAYAALALGILHDAGAAPMLREAMDAKRSDASTRSAIAVALGLLGDKASAPMLRSILEDKGNPELRGYAAVALGMMSDRSSLPSIEKVMRTDSDPNLSVSLATAMGLLGDQRATASLLANLKTTDNPFTKASMITALGFIKDRSAIDPLATILADSKERPLSRIYAAIGLGYVGDTRTMPPLADVTQDYNYLVSVSSLDQLVDLL